MVSLVGLVANCALQICYGTGIEENYPEVAYFIVACIQTYLSYTWNVHADNALIMAGLGIVSSVLAAILGKKGSHLFAGLFGPYVAG